MKKTNDYDTAINLRMPYNDSFQEILCDKNIPHPQLFQIIGSMILATWILSGRFDSYKAFLFLQDLKARFQLTFRNDDYIETTSEATKSNNAYEAKTLSRNLVSLPNFRKYSEKHAQHEKKDNIFWAIKIHCEYMLKRGVANYELLEQWALDNFLGKTDYAIRKKCRSDIRCKCRSVYNWYAERDFKLGYVKLTPREKEKYEMTRRENAKKISQARAENNKKVILERLTSLFGVEYKHADGSWNIYKVAKDLNFNYLTARKHIRQLQADGLL